MCHCDRICMAAFPVQETTCDFCFELSLQKVNSFEQGVNVEIFFRFFFLSIMEGNCPSFSSYLIAVNPLTLKTSI